MISGPFMLFILNILTPKGEHPILSSSTYWLQILSEICVFGEKFLGRPLTPSYSQLSRVDGRLRDPIWCILDTLSSTKLDESLALTPNPA